MSYRQRCWTFLRGTCYAVIFGAIALSGCAPQHKDAIMFGVNTTGGLKVGVDERQVPTVILGYSRQEAAMVPLFVYGDGMFRAAHRNLDSTTFLELARDRFENAEAAKPGDPNRKKLFEEGMRFVVMAYDAVQQTPHQCTLPCVWSENDGMQSNSTSGRSGLALLPGNELEPVLL